MEENILSRDEMEARRLKGARLLLERVSQSQVARELGVSRASVSRWHRNLREKGIDNLRKRRAPGRSCRLNQDQLDAICETYRRGPAAAGIDAPRWTTVNFADAVFALCNVRYDPDHMGRIMHKLGLKLQERKMRREAAAA